jgi:single-stranded DNA-binding protein 2
MRCSIWREAAENVAESLAKGMRVIAQGRLQQRSYTTREGEQRTVVEMQVDEIGPSLRRAKAQVTRTSGGQYNAGGQQGGGSGYQGGGQQQPTYNAPAGGSSDDPWATGGTTSFGDEPPF